MLRDVLSKELLTLNVNNSDLIGLEENMAGGVGCAGSSCEGMCGGGSGNPPTVSPPTN